MSNLNSNLSRPSTSLSSVSDVSVLFDPQRMVCTLSRLIIGSKRVVGCVAWLTHPSVLSALSRTDSSLIVTRSRLNPRKREFVSRGIKLKFLGRRRLLMHHKFLVGFDAVGPAWVSVGSFNMTRAAVRNLENLLVIRDRALASVFSAEYERLAR